MVSWSTGNIVKQVILSPVSCMNISLRVLLSLGLPMLIAGLPFLAEPPGRPFVGTLDNVIGGDKLTQDGRE